MVVLILGAASLVLGQSLRPTRVSGSKNSRYEFVERSDQDLDQIRNEVISGWKRVGFSGKELAKMIRFLDEEISKERILRNRFRVSGLYLSESVELVREIESFPNGMESVYVSDTGDFIVGLNSHVASESIGRDTPRTDLLKTNEIALIAVSVQGNQQRRCVVSVPEMLGNKYPIERGSDGFFWASSTATIDSTGGTIEIEMGDLSKTVWDVRTCRRISPPSK